jgi:hypothetical protein
MTSINTQLIISKKKIDQPPFETHLLRGNDLSMDDPSCSRWLHSYGYQYVGQQLSS